MSWRVSCFLFHNQKAHVQKIDIHLLSRICSPRDTAEDSSCYKDSSNHVVLLHIYELLFIGHLKNKSRQVLPVLTNFLPFKVTYD